MKFPNYHFKKDLYENLPDFVKLLIGSVPFSVLAGGEYRACLARDRTIDRARRDQLVAYQEKALGAILSFAVAQVPIYRPLADAVEKKRPLEALKFFPLLDKESLQRNYREHLPRDLGRIRHYECSTGGTSGNQLKFYLDDQSQSIEMAFMHRLWARIGYAPRSRKATFRGIEFRRLRDGVYWQINPVYNELQFSPYHMNNKSLSQYLEKLFEYRPEFIHGYPSAISILADYILRSGIDASPLGLKGILLGSEGLDGPQREKIEKAFQTRAFSWFGHSERLILAGECEKSTAYHHFPDYGVLEIIDDDGRAVEEDGGVGELVGTGLYNYSLPLIRYRTSDRARRRHHQCECGREFERFDQVEGRWKQEYVIGRNGSRISLAALNTHGPFFDNVVRYQYYQDQPGAMEIRLMVAKGFSERDEKAIVEAFRRKTGDELSIQPVQVEQIPLTGRGKLRRLIQETPDNGDKT